MDVYANSDGRPEGVHRNMKRHLYTFSNNEEYSYDIDDGLTMNIQERSGQTMFGRISNNIPENDVGVCRNIVKASIQVSYLYFTSNIENIM